MLTKFLPMVKVLMAGKLVSIASMGDTNLISSQQIELLDMG